MDWDQLTEALNTDGHFVLPQIVSKEEAARLSARLLEISDEDHAKYGARPGYVRDHIVQLVTYPAFAALLDHERMHEVFSHFLGETCILYSLSSVIHRPGQPARPIHVDSPRVIPGYHSSLVMTLALTDFTEETGATLHMCGTQEDEEPPTQEVFDAQAIPITRQAGDAVFFNPRVFHSSGVNNSNEIRTGIAMYACRSFMKQRLDYPRFVGEEILSQLGPRGRSFLGFDTRVPACVEDFYLPPEERLYKGGQG